MNTLGERLKHARMQAGISQETLAKILGISQGTIGHIENGVTKNTKYIVELAHAVGVRPDWLATGLGDPKDNIVSLNRRRMVKIYSLAQVPQIGQIEVLREVAPIMTIPEKDDFCLQIEGDSMESEHGKHSFPDSTFLLICPSRTPVPGDFVVAISPSNGKPMFRELSSDGIDFYLKPLNRSYQAVQIADLGCIVGVAVEWWIGGTL